MERFKNERIYFFESKYKVIESPTIDPCVFCRMRNYNAPGIRSCLLQEAPTFMLFLDCMQTSNIRVNYDGI